MDLYPINTGNLKLDGGAMFGVVPKVIWGKSYPSDENNLCNWSMRCLLIVDGDRKILIDCGIGNKQPEKFFSNYHLNGDDTLEKSLAAVGFTPDDITDVILTHLHFDHAGGAVQWNADRSGYEVVFKNATYRTSRRQWEWATSPNNREKASFLKENILPIKEKGRHERHQHHKRHNHLPKNKLLLRRAVEQGDLVYDFWLLIHMFLHSILLKHLHHH